jgi:hypothetical protein
MLEYLFDLETEMFVATFWSDIIISLTIVEDLMFTMILRVLIC